MPRNVRNFWVTLAVDGKKTNIGTGPRGAGGGFYCRIQQRSDGSIDDGVIVIEGREVRGILRLSIGKDADSIFTRTTKR